MRELSRFIRMCWYLWPEYRANGCLMFALLLWSRFPEVRLFYDHEHVMVYCYGRFFDIRTPAGIERPEGNFEPIEIYGYDHMRGSFTRMGSDFYDLLKNYFNIYEGSST